MTETNPVLRETASVPYVEYDGMASDEVTLKTITEITGSHPHLIQQVHANKHLRVEVWQAVFAALSYRPIVQGVTEIPNGYWARLALLDAADRIICTADALCDTTESGRGKWSPYAVCSMAQTRGVGKLGRLMFGHVATRAGFSATPAEEMDSIEKRSGGTDAAPLPKDEPPATMAELQQDAGFAGKGGHLKGKSWMDMPEDALEWVINKGGPAKRLAEAALQVKRGESLDEPDLAPAPDDPGTPLPQDEPLSSLQRTAIFAVGADFPLERKGDDLKAYLKYLAQGIAGIPLKPEDFSFSENSEKAITRRQADAVIDRLHEMRKAMEAEEEREAQTTDPDAPPLSDAETAGADLAPQSSPASQGLSKAAQGLLGKINAACDGALPEYIKGSAQWERDNALKNWGILDLQEADEPMLKELWGYIELQAKKPKPKTPKPKVEPGTQGDLV